MGTEGGSVFQKKDIFLFIYLFCFKFGSSERQGETDLIIKKKLA